MYDRKNIVNVLIMVMTVAMVVASVFIEYQVGYGRGVGTRMSQLSDVSSVSSIPTESHMVVGTVERISGQKITIKDFQKIPNIVANQPGRLIVVANQVTNIERFVQKDAATVKNDLATFSEKLKRTQNLTIAMTPPEPFIRKKILLNDIHVGDIVIVSAVEDISNLATFTATEIDIKVVPILKTP